MDTRCEKADWCNDHVCPPPQDNTFDFTAVTKQMKLNAELLMQEMTAHASKLMNGPQGWINVEERLPPNSKYVLVAVYDAREKVCMHFIQIAERLNGDWFDGHNGDSILGKACRVTHWMPLPDKPEKL
jgi:hypothetical protein